MPKATLDKKSKRGEASEILVITNIFLIAKEYAIEGSIKRR